MACQYGSLESPGYIQKTNTLALDSVAVPRWCRGEQAPPNRGQAPNLAPSQI